jgi:putative ABC transport system permease protein
MRKREPMWRRYARFFGPDVAADVDDELADHIACMRDDLRARGLSEPEVEMAIRGRFGDVDALRTQLRRDDGRRMDRRRRLEALGDLAQDVQYALRRLRQQPGFTATVLVVLALGVGATTAMFSAVDAAMLRPLPFRDASRLVLMPSVSVPSRSQPPGSPLGDDFRPTWRNIRAMPGLVSGIAAYFSTSANLFDPQRPARVTVGHASAGLFDVLGVAPVAGRVFSDSEARPGGPPLAVLSYGFWQGHFGGRDMLGKPISLDGTPFTVIGVMPRGFDFPDRSDLWVPIPVPFPAQVLDLSHGFPPKPNTIARLAPGVTLAAADARLFSLWRPDPKLRVPAWFPKDWEQKQLESWRHTAVALQQSFVGDRRRMLLVLLGATGLLLLIGCANVTSLLLSQATVRRREIALRAVLGAGRGRIVRQLLTEAVLLAVAGTGIGVALAPAAFGVLARIMPPTLAGIAPPELDVRVLAFAAGVALVTGIGFGLWPALTTSRADLAESARGAGATGTPGGTRSAARRVLLAGELALTVMLLVGAGLMLRSFRRLSAVTTGFDAEHAATLRLDFGTPAPPTTIRRQRLASMLERLTAAPGVQSAGATGALPLDSPGPVGLPVDAEGVPERDKTQRPRMATYLVVSSGYFDAMGIPLLRGRTFRAGDDSLDAEGGAPRAAIINRALADSLWPGADPLGRWISWSGRNARMTVVGVVANVRYFGLDRPLGPQVYMPIEAAPPSSIALVVRGAMPSAVLLARLRDAVHAVDPSQPVYDARSLDDVVRAAVAVPRTDTELIGLFGALALVLAVVGVYGVIAYSVAQRRVEFGIRAALGATGRDLTALASRELVWVAIVGVPIGLAGAWAGARVLRSLLYGVGVHDGTTYVVASVGLLVPAVAAALVPARRAARTDPMDVIRQE